MLSQLRWMMGVAIGVAIMVAVWLEPKVRDPSGEPARPRPRPEAGMTENPSARAQGAMGDPGRGPSAAVRWQARIAAYWAELDALLADPKLARSEREAAREALLARHFEIGERGHVRALAAGRARRAKADELQKSP
ncbi:MAG: lipase chaperone [Myxococcota bacterium]|nr:lipase chaperone [Myxococcota bacterium]